MQKTCIVVPCYNEEKRLDLRAFSDFLKEKTDVCFLFVNDGSSDGTADILNRFCTSNPGSVFFLDLPANVGKAEAVRLGIVYAAKDTSFSQIGFWDADLATPLSEIPIFISTMIAKRKKMVIGSRIKRMGATVERTSSRHYLGRIFSTFASIILRMPVYDTQCGAKIFDAQLSLLFTQQFKTKWLFDIEILARFRNNFGLARSLDEIMEIPVTSWIEKGGSKLRFYHMLKVPVSLYTIHKTYNK